MNYNPQIHNRRSLRLKGYDYSKPGLYFITICCQDRLCLFGDVKNGKMILNPAGQMVEKWYFEMENKYPDKRCHEMVVMPNHFHCIVENLDDIPGAPPHGPRDDHTGASLRGRPDPNGGYYKNNNNEYGMDNKKYQATIADAMDWFKTMTTNEYIRGVKTMNWPRFNRKLWQRSYWEHIIRNEPSYFRISEYIKNNPAKWDNDKMR